MKIRQLVNKSFILLINLKKALFIRSYLLWSLVNMYFFFSFNLYKLFSIFAGIFSKKFILALEPSHSFI